ncbi:hypothetical protein [Chelatococcus reniformis]|uniref:Uncharacterized protein n=1 Tax=Chelatococcus reniformis TaxID=1494448 RepID=A0A916X6R4_9HYPH|nr:hypothetical protein [Chelatococcus reniformis]GGC47245.1 hypothetical protein GCM10010994_03010 [Chelatococcus reniformis]
MIKTSLHAFAERTLDAAKISSNDVRELATRILPHDIMHRDEADLLIALDRMIDDKPTAWDDLFVRLIVDFVVWSMRPTGRVNADIAAWLTTSLAAGNGPTEAGVAAALEIVREAEQVDEALVSFVLQGAQDKRRINAPLHPHRQPRAA